MEICFRRVLTPSAVDCVQSGEDLVRQRKFGRRQILTQVSNRRCAGNKKNVRRAMEQPGERDLHGRGAEARSDGGQGGGLKRRKPAKREERHVRDALSGQVVDQGVVGPMRQIVLILNANDLANLASFSNLRRRDIA